MVQKLPLPQIVNDCLFTNVNLAQANGIRFKLKLKAIQLSISAEEFRSKTLKDMHEFRIRLQAVACRRGGKRGDSPGHPKEIHYRGIQSNRASITEGHPIKECPSSRHHTQGVAPGSTKALHATECK